MGKWPIQPRTRRFEGPAPGGADVTHGVNVYLRDAGGNERKIAVWYTREQYERNVSTDNAVRAYLDDDEPPEHLVVTSSGVSVLGDE
jgi:hypothetical protein